MFCIRLSVIFVFDFIIKVLGIVLVVVKNVDSVLKVVIGLVVMCGLLIIG